MRSSTGSIPLFVVLLLLVGVSHGDAAANVNRWNGASSTAFTQGFVRNSCPGLPPCQNDDFDLTGGSDAQCPIPAHTQEVPLACVTMVFASLDDFVRLSGFAGHFPEPGGDVFTGTWAMLHAERIDDLFVVEGEISTTGIWPGMVQVAVIRYSGDPTVFDGLEVDRVEELVGLGIIGNDDILAVELYTELFEEVSIPVEVAGLADDEIVLFAAGDGRIPPPVPATTALGAAVLVLAMLGLGAWLLRRREVRKV